MAQFTSTGVATVWNLDGTIAWTGVANSAQQIVGAKLSHSAKINELTNSNGAPIGFNASREQLKASFDLVPTGATKSAAATVATLPPALTKVTLASFMNDQWNGDWIYFEGGEVTLSPEGKVQMSLPLVKELSSPKTAAELTTAMT